ncbi:S1C family serine protease [Staphylococcus coagulans]|uniref:Serine protease HtrA-like n=1 Tax=Staphylococcus coagulans TaxID=74706 RepID=A0A9X0PE28_9STAP|nr:S1C family serine protease [Staphylococcus coagulans]MBA8771552.1 serine protease [Staphylococcus coagulans]MBA8775459.1 serine protease [Staphylococcus coagulans]
MRDFDNEQQAHGTPHENDNLNQRSSDQHFSSTHSYNPPPPRKPKLPWLKIVLISLIAGLLGGLIVFGVAGLFSNGSLFEGHNGSQVNVAKNDNGGNTLDGKSNKYKSVNEMIKDQSPAIVGVINEQQAQSLEDLLRGKSTKAEPTGIGSGVIYQKNNGDAFIVTNNHVIEGASSIKVQLHNSKQVDAKLVGTDPLTDIAVLKIKDRDDIKAITFADSSKVKTGDSVFAMGNPLGLEFSNTVTSGIISANERTIEANTSAGPNKVTVLQTDAAINPGNSGGALVDINGNLVGINSMKISAPQVEGIGFAIPSNEVKLVIEELVKYGEVKRPSIGIGMINISEIPQQYRNGIHSDSGIYVAEVQRRDIDVKKGDIITGIDGKKVDSDTDLRSYLYKNKKPGEHITLKINRDGKTKDVDVKLSESNKTS